MPAEKRCRGPRETLTGGATVLRGRGVAAADGVRIKPWPNTLATVVTGGNPALADEPEPLRSRLVTEPTADLSHVGVGVIGGSGFYSFLESAETHRVRTPFGEASGDVTVGSVRGRTVAFLPRHGPAHEFAPHQVNYRANLWALRSLGVRQILAPSAVGSLRADLRPGTFVVPDQVVDRTSAREHTVFGPGAVGHVGFADPYCPRGRASLVAAARGNGLEVVDEATMVVIDGPRFSTRAESRWHAAQGWSVVGMTGMPEAALAREMAICYSSIAMVTDHDAGVDAAGAVTQAEVLTRFARSIEALKALLAEAIAGLPGDEPDDSASCTCRRALDGLPLPPSLR
jgi:5'-methylthioadenosine phosphorylase